MNAFDFGFAVGSLEKKAIADLVGGIHGAYTAPAGHKFEGAARGAMKAPAQVAGGVVGAGAGALHGLAAGGYRGTLNVAKGMDTGANMGTKAMDAVLGGPAKGIGGKILRAPAQALGAGVGALGGAVTAPIAAVGGLASDIYHGARRGAGVGGAAVNSLMGGAPAWQQQQQGAPQKAANMMQGAQMGIMPQKQEQQNQNMPGFMNAQQMRQKFEQGVGKTFGQGAQKAVGMFNTATDALRRSNMPGMPRPNTSGNI